MITDGIAPGTPAFVNFVVEYPNHTPADWQAVRDRGNRDPLYLWISADVDVTEPIELGPLVVLAFAPEAALRMVGRGALVHRGRLASDHGACFEATPGQVTLLGVLDSLDVGWWRGVGVRPLRSAIGALHGRVQQGGDPLPLRLPDSLTGDETVVLSVPSGVASPCPITLQGEGCRWTATPSLAGPLLRIDTGVKLHAEGITFVQETEGVGAMVLHMSREPGARFVDCTWHCGRKRVALSVAFPSEFLAAYLFAVAFALQPPATRGLVENALQRGPRLFLIERCVFVGADAQALVQVELSEIVSLRVNDSVFMGSYERGITLYSGDALVLSTTFENSATFLPTVPDVGDVVCHGAPRAVQRDSLKGAMAKDLLTELDTMVVPNPQVTLTHCLSRSSRLLSSRRCWLHREAPVPSVMLNGVVHLGGSTPAEIAVLWDVSAGARGLILQATQLAATIGLTHPTDARMPTRLEPWVVVLGDDPPLTAQGSLPLLSTTQIERLNPG